MWQLLFLSFIFSILENSDRVPFQRGSIAEVSGSVSPIKKIYIVHNLEGFAPSNLPPRTPLLAKPIIPSQPPSFLLSLVLGGGGCECVRRRREAPRHRFYSNASASAMIRTIRNELIWRRILFLIIYIVSNLILGVLVTDQGRRIPGLIRSYGSEKQLHQSNDPH